MSVVVSPPPSLAPFPVPPIVLSPPPQLSSPVPASQPNAIAPPVSSLPPTLPQQSSPPPASPTLPQSPPPSNVTSPPPMASPPTESSPPTFTTTSIFSSPTSSPPPTPSPPVSSSPPPEVEPPPVSPPPQPTVPTSSPPPPPKDDPPPTSPPPQPTTPPSSPSPPPKVDSPPFSPPPPAQNPDPTPPPQSPDPPKGSPPSPPVNSPPSPGSVPPKGSPPTPASDPPTNSPPSPAFTPPQGSPPTPSLEPPKNTRPSPSVPPGGTTTNSSSDNAAGSSNSPSSSGLGTGVGWCVWKRKKKAFRPSGGNAMPTPLGSTPNSDSILLKIQESTPDTRNGTGNKFLNSPGGSGGFGNPKIWFTYEELVKATGNFSAENLLGAGGFGSVYKGCLPDGRDIAVKQLDIGGSQGDREFRAEVEIISRVHHRHLVSLVAEGRPVMDWTTRVKIAVGAARGIAYLHEDCHPRIIHRDIKSSNILLDINFEARVSDFGLAKLAQDAKTHVTTRVVGTFGYMAPEYASSGKLTEKSDIYSFGVVLLELITGRKPVDTSQPLGDESLVEWARPLLSHALEKLEFDQLADPRLERNYVVPEMFQLIEAAAACVRHSAAKRPGMGQIMRAFDNMSASDLTNGMKVGESTIYNSAEQSAEIRLFRRMAFGSPDFSSDFFSQGTQHSGESAEDR
ncbi:hypothetical protein H5410_025217, partial [Solanum commersonii]